MRAKSCTIILLIVTCIAGMRLHAQNVLDDVYVDENTPRRWPVWIGADIEYPMYYIKRPDGLSLNELKTKTFDYEKEGEFVVLDRSSTWEADSIHRKLYFEKLNTYKAWLEYYRLYFSKPPLKFDECVYFDPSLAGREQSTSNHEELMKRRFYQWPEALRFYSVPQDSNVTVNSLKGQLATHVNSILNPSPKDSTNHEDMVDNDKLLLSLRLRKPLKEIFSPFYFKKTTITNKEYREFVDYVKDSIIRTMLYNAGMNSMVIDTIKHVLNWKTKFDLNDQELRENVADLYLPDAKRFYRHPEWDTRRLNYLYYTLRIKDRIQKIMINIYPDTLVWVHDFSPPSSFIEYLTNMYFWHPKYDDYPVVGITQGQAIAYLNWKTEQEQKKLDAKGEPWIIKYELPTEYESEIVETASKQKNGDPSIYPDKFEFYNDKTYLCDLSVTEKYSRLLKLAEKQRLGIDSVVNKRPIHASGLFNSAHPLNTYRFETHYRVGKREKENFYYTLKADFQKNEEQIKKNPLLTSSYDYNGISFMGGNVSEWMQETYKDNWLSIYTYQHKILEAVGTEDTKRLMEREDYYNSKNDTNGVLVRGANWYDQRFGGIGGKNTDGMNAKTFVNPDSCHSTIGFRYVIRLYRKDEKQLLDKIKPMIKEE